MILIIRASLQTYGLVVVVFVVMDLMLLISDVLVLDLIHAMPIFLVVMFLVVVVARYLMNTVVMVHMVLMVVVDMGMVLMMVVMVLMVMVGMLEFISVHFNMSSVILEAERLDLVDLPTSISISPWPLHFRLPQLDSRLDPVPWMVSTLKVIHELV